MDILILGGHSFASTGLVPALQSQGHTVFQYIRGEEGRNGSVVSGSVDTLENNPHWPPTMDVVINFLLLRNQSVERNVKLCQQVLNLCRRLRCRSLIHISSVMAYAFTEQKITESSPIAQNHRDKLFYAAVKIATENYLSAHQEGLTLHVIRPGFILGAGLGDAMVGSAWKIPGGLLVVLGNPNQVFPLISRDALHDAITKIVESPGVGVGENYLLVDPNSPTREEYIRGCCFELGQGKRVLALGRWFWFPAAIAAECLTRVLGKGSPRILSRVAFTFKSLSYDSSHTQSRLGISLHREWKRELRASYDGQQPNYRTPEPHCDQANDLFPSVLFIGFGSIVHQKHLPALRELGFQGTIQVFDPYLRPDSPLPERCVKVADVARSDAPVVVIATPAPAHTHALSKLPSTARLILVEKPLSPVHREWSLWQSFEQRTGAKVLVIHNYRYKQNVLAFLEHLRRFNSGELRSCRVVHDTAPSSSSAEKWRRDERGSKIMLYDGGLHYLDLACMFGTHYRGVRDIEWRANARGETSEITGVIQFSNYPVTFYLRQGHGMFRFQIYFEFVNYSVRLTFHPDTMIVLSGNDMIMNRAWELWNDLAFTFKWCAGKITGRDHDQSHVRVYKEGIACWHHDRASQLSLPALAPIYGILNDISEIVYQHGE